MSDLRTDKIDLSYLSDEEPEDQGPPKPARSGEIIAKGSVGNNFYDPPKGNRQSGKSVGAISMGMVQMASKPIPVVRKVEMDTVDVKSNFARDRVEVFGNGDLILRFDQNGIAKMPTHKMYLLEQVQRARPGRFTVVRPQAPASPPVAAEVVPIPVAAPIVVKPTPKKVELKETPAPVAEKKNLAKPNKKKTRGRLVSSKKVEAEK